MKQFMHIFTDGLDKLLSVSIWGKYWGGKDAFFYYQDGLGLSGYLSKADYEKLSVEGLELLNDPQFIKKLKSDTDALTKKYQDTKQTNDILSTSELLSESYKQYFYTEEYYTGKLDINQHAEIIDQIGKLRLNFIETCIGWTKKLQNLADIQYPQGDGRFLTIQEILNQEIPDDITQRKIAFLYRPHHQTELAVSKAATTIFQQLTSEPKTSGNSVVQGNPASRGVVEGIIYKISLTSPDLNKEINHMPENAILLTESTQPAMLLACQKASGIITDEGGILSHAAIISWEINIPCIVGTRNATKLFNTGDRVFLDANSGTVNKLK